MRSEKYYNKIMCIDTLLSFNGVIPSLAEFQLKVVNLIEQFSKALISEGECEQLSDDLCHIICSYLDKHISLHLNASNISWERNLLARHFYGYDKEFGSLTDRLDIFLKKSEGNIFHYAYQLLPLILQSLGHDEKIIALISHYAPEPVTEITQDIGVAEEKREELTLFVPEKSRNRWRNPFYWQAGTMLFLLLALWIYCRKYLDGLY